ncbi:MAG: zinc ribbon domain-containing protein [Promethearchaeota archaeon]
MILQDLLTIISILNIAIRVLAILVALGLTILVGVVTLQKKLEPHYNKGFSISVVIYLILVMFSFIVGFLFIESNNSFSNILFSFSLEIYLFHKKSKWKFGILATILLGFSIILKITFLVINLFLYNYLAIVIASIVIDVLLSLNNIILGIVILNLLRKTANENPSLKTYTKPISIGVVFIFIIKSLITSISTIPMLIYYLGENYDYFEIYYSFRIGIPILSILVIIIGLIFIAIGSLKTMNVPLMFSKDKGIKETLPRKETRYSPQAVIYCPKCGVSISPDVPFCTNCGDNLKK